jgi:branched-chain amino acid transport system permease protein
MVEILGQLLVGGIVMAMIYVLLSAGIVFIVSVTQIFYLPYAHLFMVGAFVVWAGVNFWHLPFFLSLLMAMLGTTVLGLLSYLLIFQHTIQSESKFLATITAALGFLIIVGQSVLLIFGGMAHGLPPIIPGKIEWFGINISLDKVLLIGAAILMISLLFFYYSKTKIGRAMRAVSFNSETASLQGINPKRIYLISVVIGTALAGFAGGMIAPSLSIYPDMGDNFMLPVVLIAMVGGIDSLVGATLTGFVVGLTLSFAQYFTGTYAQVILFFVVGIIVFFKPNGLMGHGTEIGV